MIKILYNFVDFFHLRMILMYIEQLILYRSLIILYSLKSFTHYNLNLVYYVLFNLKNSI